MKFNLFRRKRDTFASDDIEDRVCRTLEYKLNIMRHHFLTSGIPIVKKEMMFNYIEHTVEVHMNNMRTVDIHLIMKDTSGHIPYIVSDMWTRIETRNCHKVGIYGICIDVKKRITKKTCRQLWTLMGYAFMQNYLGERNVSLEAETSVKAMENQKIVTVNLNDVKIFAHIDPEDRLNWLLSRNFTIEEISEINRLYNEMKNYKGDESNHEQNEAHA